MHVGKKFEQDIKITVIDYSKEEANLHENVSLDNLSNYKDSNSVSWINIDGLHDTKVIAEVGKLFNIHPLIQEDILNTRQRPKVEEMEHQVFVSLKMLGINEERDEILTEQVSFVMGPGYVVSFQEQQGDVFDALRRRILSKQGMILKQDSDFLLYRLMDTIVDNYFFVAEFFGESLEELEDKVLERPDSDNLLLIQRMKKLMIQFRRNTSPLREVVSMIDKDEHPLISKNTKRYLRDLYEHVIQVTEAIETQRDIINGVTDLHTSGINNQMNQVMQVLTIIATIFIPLTFIAGIYGMNFENMPELKWEYGYYYVWGLIFVIFVLMLVYFRRKRWL